MNKPIQRGRVLLIWLAIALLLGGTLITLKLRQPPMPAMQAATLLPNPRALAPFQLVDQQGAPFDLARLKNHWSLIFFGYTHCPDVCPTTLTDLKTTLKLLHQQYPDVEFPQVIFVSVDPDRDTPEVLRRYVAYFNPEFLGVTGSTEAIVAFSRQLNAFFTYVKPDPDATDYPVDHSASVSLIDPRGRLHAIFSPPLDPRAVAHDYAAIVNYAEALQ